MYKPPIELITSNIMTEIRKSQDNQIYQAVLNAGVNVDKDELIKALSYDRQQYKKGYADGVKAVIKKIKEKSFDNLTFQGWIYSEMFLDSIAAEMAGDTE